MAHIFRGTLREEAGALVEVPPDVLAALGPHPPLGKTTGGTFYAAQTFS
jgi:hypothetical protein